MTRGRNTARSVGGLGATRRTRAHSTRVPAAENTVSDSSSALHEPGLGLLRYSPGVRRTLRLLLICVLSLALPFKALAGVAMIGCGPTHHASMLLMAAAKPAVHSDAAAAHGAHAMHAEHTMAPGDPTADAAANIDGAASADGAKPAVDHGANAAKAAKVKCSSCAPCCAAAAPAPDAHRWPTAEPSHREAAFLGDRYSGVVTDVPHEPPRLILA